MDMCTVVPTFEATAGVAARSAPLIAAARTEAAFFNWHTTLISRPGKSRVMRVSSGSYQYAFNPDGSVKFVLIDLDAFINLLFPATAEDTITPIGQPSTP